MCGHEQRIHGGKLSISLRGPKNRLITTSPLFFCSCKFGITGLSPLGKCFTLCPPWEVFHCMGGALGVAMMTAGACGGWTSVGTELQGEHLALAYARMNVEK